MRNEEIKTIIAEISDKQWVVAFVLLIFSASLSVIGSTTIAFKIMRDRKRNGNLTPYDRIVLGLSFADITASIVYAIYPFLLPSTSNLYIWSFGNDFTCQIVAFLFQVFPIWAIWYNCILSFYFLINAISQIRRTDYFRKFEFWLHLSGIFFPVTAIIFKKRGWFGEVEPFGICWVTNQNGRLIFIIALLLSYFSVIISYIAIYIIVRKTLRQSNGTNNLPGPTTLQKNLKNEAITIMFLYVGCYLIPVIPLIIAELGTRKFGVVESYRLYFLTITLLPLQGFFNCFIYIRPAYTRFRAAHPNRSMYFVLHQALFNPSVPQLYYPSNASSAPPVGDGSAMFTLNFKESIEESFPDPKDREISKREDSKEEE